MKRLFHAVLTTAAVLSMVEPALSPARAAAPDDRTATQGTGGGGHATGGEHPHTAPHGGQVTNTSKGHLELVASKDGTFKLYVLDDTLASLPVAGGTGTLKLTVPGYGDVKLVPEGDHLTGKGKPFQAEHVTAVVSVTVGGTTQTGRFSLHLKEGGHGDSHGGHDHGAAQARPGFRAELQTEPAQVKAGQPTTLVFSVKNAQGTLVRELPPVHEKPFHLLIVSRDLQEFFHVHPEPQPDGTFRVAHTFPSGGDYTLFADFTPKGSDQVVERIKLSVAGKPQPQVALQADSSPTRTQEGLRVTLSPSKPLRAGEDAVLQFAVAEAKTGKPVTDLQPYLGAFAHFVILSEESTDFLHAHPLEEVGTKGVSPSQVSAHTRFPRAGLYKVWVQLQRQGKVATVPFVLRVAAASIPADAIRVKVSGAGYEPSRVTARKGQPLKLAFLREDANNCAGKVVFPSLGLERELPVGQTVLVELTPKESGELTFTCGMSMYRGALVVQN